MSHPVHLPEALLSDIDAALDAMPAGMTRAALMRRLLRAGLLAEGQALTEDRGAVVPREWPAVQVLDGALVADMLGQFADALTDGYLEQGGRYLPADIGELANDIAAGPVVLRLDLDPS